MTYLINFIHRKNFDSNINKEKIQKRKKHAINIQKHAHKQHKLESPLLKILRRQLKLYSVAMST